MIVLRRRGLRSALCHGLQGISYGIIYRLLSLRIVIFLANALWIFCKILPLKDSGTRTHFPRSISQSCADMSSRRDQDGFGGGIIFLTLSSQPCITWKDRSCKVSSFEVSFLNSSVLAWVTWLCGEISHSCLIAAGVPGRPLLPFLLAGRY